MDQKFFIANRKKLENKIEEGSMVILFSGAAPQKSADERYAFTVNRNFYYMCGIEEEYVKLVLIKAGGVVSATLFIKESDPVRAKWVGETISREKAQAVSGIEDIRYEESFEQFMHLYISHKGIQKIYFDFERDSFKGALTETEKFAGAIKERYPYASFKNIYPIMSELRMVKAKEEIDKIQEAIDITVKGVEALMCEAKSGVKEYELEAYFDFVLKTHGVKDYAFKTIAASGVHATVLHYASNDSIIPEESLILFDLGAQVDYYNADITRTFPVEGKFTERQKQFYNIVLAANEAVIEAIKPGVPFVRLNEIVKELYLEKLKELGMAENMEDVSKYYYHGVSHFLGLDTHDVGERGVTLQEGMVLTVEPGLYIEEESIGIRIEDDVVVTKDGCLVLTKKMIKTVEEIEAFMDKK